MAMDVVEFGIRGSGAQFVEVELDAGEAGDSDSGGPMFIDAGTVIDAVLRGGAGTTRSAGLHGGEGA
jgi:uncharacterized protein (AIM24 family)